MANNFFSGLCPLGKFTIAAAGTTQLLSANLGSQTENPQAPQGGIPTRVFREIWVSTDKANTGQIFLLPKGKTAAGNPADIIASFPPGCAPTPIPGSIGSSINLDLFCFDTDTANSVCYAGASQGS